LTPDLREHLRRIKPDRHLSRLKCRPRDALVAAGDVAGAGRASILLDTNVYIRSAAGTLSRAAEALVEHGLLFHCVVCVAELSTGVANADPSHRGWKALRDHYAGLVARIPSTRLLTPDPETWI
jgi:hypothetical protein